MRTPRSLVLPLILLALPALAANRAAMGPRLGAVHDLIRSVPDATQRTALVGLLTGRGDLAQDRLNAQAILDGQAAKPLSDAQLEAALAGSAVGKALDADGAPSAANEQRYAAFIAMVRLNKERLNVAETRLSALRAPAFDSKAATDASAAAGEIVVAAPGTVGLKSSSEKIEASQAAAAMNVVKQVEALSDRQAAMATLLALTVDPGVARTPAGRKLAGAAVLMRDGKAVFKEDGSLYPQAAAVIRAALTPFIDRQGARNDPARTALIALESSDPAKFLSLVAQAHGAQAKGDLTEEAGKLIRSRIFVKTSSPFSTATESELELLREKVLTDGTGTLKASVLLGNLILAMGKNVPLNPAAEKARVAGRLSLARAVVNSAGRRPGDSLPHEDVGARPRAAPPSTIGRADTAPRMPLAFTLVLAALIVAMTVALLNAYGWLGAAIAAGVVLAGGPLLRWLGRVLS